MEMTSTTSTSSAAGPLTIESLRAVMAKMPDLATRVRCSPTAYFMLKNRLPPSLCEVPPLSPGFFIHGLPCELDFELAGLQTEIDYRSGKIDKFDLQRKAVANGH